MAGGDLDEELRAFIAAHFRSIEQLEILLLLRADSGRPWTVDAVFQHIRSSIASVSLRLVELCDMGFLEAHDVQPQTFGYAPRTTDLSKTVDRLAEAYKARRVAVVQAIYGDSKSAATDLAKVFRLRKPKS